MIDYTPDVVDANTIAWDTFTATLDVDLLEMERATRTAPREVALHELQQERFGSRKHHEMVRQHQLVVARSRKVLDDYKPEPVFEQWQLDAAMRALSTYNAVTGERR